MALRNIQKTDIAVSSLNFDVRLEFQIFRFGSQIEKITDAQI